MRGLQRIASLGAIVSALSVVAQTNIASSVFKSALEQIDGQSSIPVVLPSRLPSVIRAKDIKLASGHVSRDGYEIFLYNAETGSEASFAASFYGTRHVVRGIDRRVALTGDRLASFHPVSCGGSCAPATLEWEQNGAMYTIQIKLRSTMAERQQQRILVDAANASVIESGSHSRAR